MSQNQDNTKIKLKMDSLLEKHYILSYTGTNTTYNLPNPESMFKELPWRSCYLQMLKNNLNKVKSRLNDYNLQKWHVHTSQMNMASDIVHKVRQRTKAELVTQAWCKFYEIASRFFIKESSKSSFLHQQTYGREVSFILERVLLEHEPTISDENFISVHLCEAPGAFVASLNHWLKKTHSTILWDWLATTLNPYYEGNSYDTMIADDRLIKHTLKHWCFGADNTGDIMNLENLDALVKKSESFTKPIKLVTADGSIDCTNMPAEQESTVAQLQFCETVACMHLLDEGGIFVLKVFTLFEHQSVCLMYLLSCVFHEVIITKPTCSKAGNSERYVVCKNFKGKKYVAPYLNILRQHYGKVSPAKAMINLRDIPEDFVLQIYDCNRFFNDHQCKIIEHNIKTYLQYKTTLECDLPQSCISHIYRWQESKRDELTAKYFSEFKLGNIFVENQIVGRETIDNCFTNKYHSTHLSKVDSYNERLELNVKPQKLLYRYFQDAKKIKLPGEESYNWNLQILPESLEIQISKPFNKVRSSYFCDAIICQMLNGTDSIVQHFGACSSPAEITTEVARQMSAKHEILNLEFNCDSHRIIVEIYDRLEKLEIGQTLVLIGYSLLTQFNIGLLHLLANSFDGTSIEIQDYRGYYIELKIYQRNEKVLNYLREILTASHLAHEKNMVILSIMPIINLYERDQVLIIKELNHLMIKLYIGHVFYKFLTEKNSNSDDEK